LPISMLARFPQAENQNADINDVLREYVSFTHSAIQRLI